MQPSSTFTTSRTRRSCAEYEGVRDFEVTRARHVPRRPARREHRRRDHGHEQLADHARGVRGLSRPVDPERLRDGYGPPDRRAARQAPLQRGQAASATRTRSSWARRARRRRRSIRPTGAPCPPGVQPAHQRADRPAARSREPDHRRHPAPSARRHAHLQPAREGLHRPDRLRLPPGPGPERRPRDQPGSDDRGGKPESCPLSGVPVLVDDTVNVKACHHLRALRWSTPSPPRTPRSSRSFVRPARSPRQVQRDRDQGHGLDLHADRLTARSAARP